MTLFLVWSFLQLAGLLWEAYGNGVLLVKEDQWKRASGGQWLCRPPVGDYCMGISSIYTMWLNSFESRLKQRESWCFIFEW